MPLDAPGNLDTLGIPPPQPHHALQTQVHLAHVTPLGLDAGHGADHRGRAEGVGRGDDRLPVVAGDGRRDLAVRNSEGFTPASWRASCRPSSALTNVCHSSVRSSGASSARSRSTGRPASSASPPVALMISSILVRSWRRSSQYFSCWSPQPHSVSGEREGQDGGGATPHGRSSQQRRERLRGLLGRGVQPGRVGSGAEDLARARRQHLVGARRRRSRRTSSAVPPWAPTPGTSSGPLTARSSSVSPIVAPTTAPNDPIGSAPALSLGQLGEHARPRRCARRRSGRAAPTAPPGWRSGRARTPRRRARAPSRAAGRGCRSRGTARR